MDAAQKYRRGMNDVRRAQPTSEPDPTAANACSSFRHLPNPLEAVAASYNGGDNVARWVRRAKQKDPRVYFRSRF